MPFYFHFVEILLSPQEVKRVLVISQNLSMKKRFTQFSDKITKEEDELPHLGVSFFWNTEKKISISSLKPMLFLLVFWGYLTYCNPVIAAACSSKLQGGTENLPNLNERWLLGRKHVKRHAWQEKHKSKSDSFIHFPEKKGLNCNKATSGNSQLAHPHMKTAKIHLIFDSKNVAEIASEPNSVHREALLLLSLRRNFFYFWKICKGRLFFQSLSLQTKKIKG